MASDAHKVTDPFQYFEKQEITNAIKALINFNSDEMSEDKRVRSEYFKTLSAVLAKGMAANIKKADLPKKNFSIGKKTWTGAEAVMVAVTMKMIKLGNTQGKALKMPAEKPVKRNSKIFEEDELALLFDNAPAITAEEIAERNKRNEAARKKTQTASGDNDDRQTSLV